MTAAISPDPTAHRGSFVSQTAVMSKRAILAVIRQPSVVVPSLLFPLFFLALGTASFSRATSIPGFPAVDSFLDFALAGAIVQGVLFGSTVSATALATDIENGFFDRLMASPTSRTSILIGRLAGAMAFGAFQTALFVAILLPFGLHIQSGPLGVLLMVVGGLLVALAVGGLLSALAIKTGSSEAVQGAFPLLFILLFFSSTFFPRETMTGFHRTIADLNPVSFIAEGFRSLTIEPLTATAAVEVVLLPLGLAVATLTLSLGALRARIAAR